MINQVMTLKFNGYNGFKHLRQLINEYLRKISGQELPLMEVALNEAVNNAIAHSPDDSAVRLKINIIRERVLVIRVKNQGKGFAAQRYLTKQGSMDKNPFDTTVWNESGRGMLIMKALADCVVYNKQGTEVLLAKYIDNKDARKDGTA